MNKNELRIFAKEKRTQLNIKKISEKICKNIENQDFYKYSDNILGFFPMKYEIDVTYLYKDNSKNWYLPRVEHFNKSLTIHPYKSGDSLIKSKWNVYEPERNKEKIDIKKINIVIIPALMMDIRGYRLGYGAGFYDRFMPGLRKDCLKLAIIPDELLIENIPNDHWDIPANIIISQSKTLKIS